jgi:hypothetical protein
LYSKPRTDHHGLFKQYRQNQSGGKDDEVTKTIGQTVALGIQPSAFRLKD